MPASARIKSNIETGNTERPDVTDPPVLIFDALNSVDSRLPLSPGNLERERSRSVSVAPLLSSLSFFLEQRLNSVRLKHYFLSLTNWTKENTFLEPSRSLKELSDVNDLDRGSGG